MRAAESVRRVELAPAGKKNHQTRYRKFHVKRLQSLIESQVRVYPCNLIFSKRWTHYVYKYAPASSKILKCLDQNSWEIRHHHH
jgi:hypothetical protein